MGSGLVGALRPKPHCSVKLAARLLFCTATLQWAMGSGLWRFFATKQCHFYFTLP